MDIEYFSKKWAYPFTFLKEASDVAICEDFEIEYEDGFTFENLFEKVLLFGKGFNGTLVSPIKGFWILKEKGLIHLDITKGVFQSRIEDDDRLDERLIKGLRIRGVIADQASLLLYDPKIALEELLTCSNRNIRESAKRLLT
jgi:hypothetical protein